MTTQLVTSVVPATMSSRDVAELTGKRHRDVLRDIDNLLESLSADLRLGFESSTYKDNTGKGNRMFVMDRDSTYCLVAGYDANARMRIIKRWQELEAAPDQTFDLAAMSSMALRQLATKIDECVALTARVVTMQPKADYFDRLMGTHGTVDLETAAKALRTSRPKLVNLLQDRGILTKKCLPAQIYIDRDYMRVQLTPYKDVYGRDQISQKTVITQPGLLYIRGLIDDLERNKAIVIREAA